MLDAGEAMRTADRAAQAAREFFGLSEEWEIFIEEMQLEDEAAASVVIHLDYLRAFVRFNLREFQSFERLWRYIGHEVAHLVIAEHRLAIAAIEAQLENPLPPAAEVAWLHADERAVSRLERMFIRERPYRAKEGKKK